MDRFCLLAVALIVLPRLLVVHQDLATLLKQSKHFFGTSVLLFLIYFILFSQIMLFVFFASPGNGNDRPGCESRYKAKFQNFLKSCLSVVQKRIVLLPSVFLKRGIWSCVPHRIILSDCSNHLSKLTFNLGNSSCRNLMLSALACWHWSLKSAWLLLVLSNGFLMSLTPSPKSQLNEPKGGMSLVTSWWARSQSRWVWLAEQLLESPFRVESQTAEIVFPDPWLNELPP